MDEKILRVNPSIRTRITAAADAFVLEGILNPTNDQIRTRMGGGSLSDISPVMRVWRDERQAHLTTAIEMPTEMKRAMEASLSQLWATASKLAATALEGFQTEASKRLQAAYGERDEALHEVSHLESSLAQQEKLLAESQTRYKELDSLLSDFRERYHSLTNEVAELKTRVSERGDQLTILREELKESRENSKLLQDQLLQIVKNRSLAVPENTDRNNTNE